TDARALQKAGNPNSRVAACWYGNSFTIDVNLTDGQQHQVALYLLNWDNTPGRSDTVQVVDVTSGKVLDTETPPSFVNGLYLVYSVCGHVHSQVSGTRAVVSGLFFGPPTAPPQSPPTVTTAGSLSGTQNVASNFNLGSFTDPLTNDGPWTAT